MRDVLTSRSFKSRSEVMSQSRDSCWARDNPSYLTGVILPVIVRLALPLMNGWIKVMRLLNKPMDLDSSRMKECSKIIAVFVTEGRIKPPVPDSGVIEVPRADRKPE
jgi:hypothetical protein